MANIWRGMRLSRTRFATKTKPWHLDDYYLTGADELVMYFTEPVSGMRTAVKLHGSEWRQVLAFLRAQTTVKT